MKQLWMLVGGNGSGKTTFYEQVLRPLGMPFINADNIAKDVYPDNPEKNSYNAAKLAETLRAKQLQTGNSFCFETVFSHPSKVDFIAQAKALGYEIILVVIHVNNINLNMARVLNRVENGGHNVPLDKIESRIPRTLNNIKLAIELCDQVRVFDNSYLDNPFQPVITIKQGATHKHISPLPDWAAALISEPN